MAEATVQEAYVQQQKKAFESRHKGLDKTARELRAEKEQLKILCNGGMIHRFRKVKMAGVGKRRRDRDDA